MGWHWCSAALISLGRDASQAVALTYDMTKHCLENRKQKERREGNRREGGIEGERREGERKKGMLKGRKKKRQEERKDEKE